AAAFAWFCPSAEGVRDEQLAAAIFGTPGGPSDWAERLRAGRINHVIVYDTDRDRLFSALRQLLADPARWPLLHLEGDLAVFGWRDPQAIHDHGAGHDLFRGLEVDLDRRAFHPDRSERAPARCPDPVPRRWWAAFYKPAPGRPIDRDAAALHLLHGE